MGTIKWDASCMFSSNQDLVGLVTPYNLPKTVNLTLKSNKKLLFGAITVDSLRSKSGSSGFSSTMMVSKCTETGTKLVERQTVEFKANVPGSTKNVYSLTSPIVIEPNCDYKFRFIFDNNWNARNYYCLSKIVNPEHYIDEETTVIISPDRSSGDGMDNELPLVMYFNRI